MATEINSKSEIQNPVVQSPLKLLPISKTETLNSF